MTNDNASVRGPAVAVQPPGFEIRQSAIAPGREIANLNKLLREGPGDLGQSYYTTFR